MGGDGVSVSIDPEELEAFAARRAQEMGVTVGEWFRMWLATYEGEEPAA
jgi:hypothetical protein